MFALSILGLLMSEPLHGYEIRLVQEIVEVEEIRKQLGELLGLSGAISYGSLYPTLARLHSQGLIATTTGEPQTQSSKHKFSQVNVFSTGSLTGDIAFGSQSPFVRKTAISNPRKSKKVYTITEKGMASFKTKLMNSYIQHADDDKAFVAHLAFLDQANKEETRIFLDNRTSALVKRLNAIPSTDHQTLKLWRDVEREYVENQIAFLRTMRDELTEINLKK